MLCPWSRTCKKCKEYLPITAFSFRKDSQTYRFFCKKCRTLSNKEYFLKNPNKKIESIRKKRIHYKKNSKRLIAQRNKAIANKNWNQWRTKNKERLNKNRKLRRIYDHNFRIKNCLRGRICEALKGKSKSASTMKLLGCSIEELWRHLESKFESWMTRENHGLWHVDHIKPCASFNLTDPEQQKKCFHYTNLQPLWAKENLSKGAKIVSRDITSLKT